MTLARTDADSGALVLAVAERGRVMLRAQPWRMAAIALWLFWTGHVYFDASINRCIALFFLALLATTAAGLLTAKEINEC